MLDQAGEPDRHDEEQPDREHDRDHARSRPRRRRRSPARLSGSWALAEIPSARRPIASDSTSATTPRITGSR